MAKSEDFHVSADSRTIYFLIFTKHKNSLLILAVLNGIRVTGNRFASHIAYRFF
jgi:hypothetical protein